MRPPHLAAALGAAFLIAAAPRLGQAADVALGRAAFRQQCGGCHVAGPGDGEGGQGPSLVGLIGRKVAGDPEFSYSRGLSAASGVWTQARLESFMADPPKAIPGTRMPAKVPSAAQRADIAAYLARVR